MGSDFEIYSMTADDSNPATINGNPIIDGASGLVSRIGLVKLDVNGLDLA